jgi:AcrR family transcriptional regulator
MSSRPRTRERVAQKLRTRQALLDAARDLVAAGRTPTVADAADAAKVSRATAYRYFPSQEALLVEVPLQVGVPTVRSLFGSDTAPTDPEDRAALVHNALYDHVREHEAQFRLFLRNALLRSTDPDRTDEPLRRAGRVALLDAALEPLEGELDSEQLERLKAALSVLIGTEATIVLHDVMHLDHEQARSSGEWAVRQMIRAARNPPPATAAMTSRP